MPSATLRRAASMSLFGAAPPDPRRPPLGCRRGEHPTAAHARDADSRVAQQAGRRLHAELGELVAPYGDVGNTVPGAGFDHLFETRALRGDLIEAESGDPRACARGQ